jgi:hypothetical protein
MPKFVCPFCRAVLKPIYSNNEDSEETDISFNHDCPIVKAIEAGETPSKK